MLLSEFLAEARDEIHMGWAKNAWRNGDRVCAVSALDRVAMRYVNIGGVQCHKAAHDALLEKAREMFPEVKVAGVYGSGVGVPTYNDAPGRTKEEMENLFDKTIIGLEEKGL